MNTAAAPRLVANSPPCFPRRLQSRPVGSFFGQPPGRACARRYLGATAPAQLERGAWARNGRKRRPSEREERAFRRASWPAGQPASRPCVLSAAPDAAASGRRSPGPRRRGQAKKLTYVSHFSPARSSSSSSSFESIGGPEGGCRRGHAMGSGAAATGAHLRACCSLFVAALGRARAHIAPSGRQLNDTTDAQHSLVCLERASGRETQRRNARQMASRY